MHLVKSYGLLNKATSLDKKCFSQNVREHKWHLITIYGHMICQRLINLTSSCAEFHGLSSDAVLFCLITLALQINTNFSSLIHRFCQVINLKMLKLRCFVSFTVVFCGVMLGRHFYNVKPV